MAESVWDYPRPPRVEPTGRHVVVRHRGVTVADSHACRRVLETSHPPVYYVPRPDVTAGLLVASSRRTYCEYKGVATYWSVRVGDDVLPDAAWSYEQPTPGYESLTGALAFYPSALDECTVDGERVVAQLGDFYGGWLTSDIVGPIKGGPGTGGW
jgi:uncharacterized protein (DUF427 family)